MITHFTADTHFDHDEIAMMADRNFPSTEVHNDTILTNINKRVAPTDRLFVLGDFAWRGAESFLRSIACKNIHLIIGNHDRANAAKLFKSAEKTDEVKIGQGETKYKVWLSHYPHAFWPASHYNSLHLYGHVHAEREEWLDAALPGRRSMDVGVDNAYRLLGEYRPFSEFEILSILSDRPGHDPVKYYHDRQIRRKIAREEQQRLEQT
jgi:calcineurin-like phosphoesterase family protein